MENPKQQIIEHLKKANNVLVTVSKDPSVDQLAAAIGMSLLLTRLNKHAAAVFSGQVPSTIEFLHPENTIEKTTDSLRDFIISLDKSKADKLRYKVEDEHVKIFITPYRSSISQDDLDFSQGDFNVDVILALGIRNQADIDQAIMAHGRILHDATVITVDLEQGTDLTGVNWTDTHASSLCEMMTTIADDLQKDALDGQIANALLTGIVAETARFSNQRTSATTMTASARLLAAGADQQLVAEQLQPKAEPVPAAPAHDSLSDADGGATFNDMLASAHLGQLAEGAAEDANPGQPAGELPGDTGYETPSPDNDMSLIVTHGDQPVTPVNLPAQEEPEPEENDDLSQIHINDQGELLPSPAPMAGDRLPDGDETFLSSLAKQSDMPLAENGPPSLGHKLLSHSSGPTEHKNVEIAIDTVGSEQPGPVPEADQTPVPDAVAAPEPTQDAIQTPDQPAHQTLAQIEQSLFSPHAMEPGGANAAVLPGVAPGGPAVPPPIDLLGAPTVHSDDETIVAPTDLPAAPAVPPPMAPTMTLPPVQLPNPGGVSVMPPNAPAPAPGPFPGVPPQQ